MVTTDHKPVLIVIAGPNGSGRIIPLSMLRVLPDGWWKVVTMCLSPKLFPATTSPSWITGSVLLIIFRSLISLCFITCLIRISLNLKNDQKNRPHDPWTDGWSKTVRLKGKEMAAGKGNNWPMDCPIRQKWHIRIQKRNLKVAQLKEYI